ncbi:ester cyclase [Piscinibacter terrae]|uniref:ester cyclase n=1 Tax=Piscinibacter terrae TaxID=2496871 RepID=UPI00138662FC|nr:ester cyclase [Albitalea terrae]
MFDSGVIEPSFRLRRKMRTMMTIDDTTILQRNRELVTRYFEEVWNQGQLDLLDELMAPDYINHSSSTPNPRPGPADLKPIVAEMRRGIPDLHYDILDMVVAADKVAVHLRMTGTHTGTLFKMQPQGRRIDVRQMQIEWIRGGRIAQHWRLTDDLALLRQIGQL